ncbi:MAG: tetratricopeptide repeat protein [Cocleimonas sp.]
MTNRQSNIIFYSVISLIVYALIIHFAYPEYFEDFSKSKEELSIKKAMNNGEHKKALTLYQEVINERMSDDNANNSETAVMYEDMAKLYFLLGNKAEEKNHYLKSLTVKEQLKKNDLFGFANTYEKLGSLAEEDKQYDQAQMYYEKSILQRLGNIDTDKKEDKGMISGMHQARLDYIRLNNEATIATFKKLGAIHNLKKEFSIAKKYYEQALTASKLTFGEEDVKTMEIMHLMKRLAL